jgi:hypothetical protein
MQKHFMTYHLSGLSAVPEVYLLELSSSRWLGLLCCGCWMGSRGFELVAEMQSLTLVLLHQARPPTTARLPFRIASLSDDLQAASRLSSSRGSATNVHSLLELGRAFGCPALHLMSSILLLRCTCEQLYPLPSGRECALAVKNGEASTTAPNERRELHEGL